MIQARMKKIHSTVFQSNENENEKEFKRETGIDSMLITTGFVVRFSASSQPKLPAPSPAVNILLQPRAFRIDFPHK